MTTPRRNGRFGHIDDGSDSFSSSPLARSSSTPFELYKSRQDAAAPQTPDGTRSAFVSGGNRYSPYGSGYSMTPADSNSPIRRKGTSIGSPGIRVIASRLSGGDGSSRESPVTAPTKQQTAKQRRQSKAFIRRKTLKQRLIELPSDLLEYPASLSLALAEHLKDPNLGYPIGLGLHALALVSHFISPKSELSLSLLMGIDGSIVDQSLFSSAPGSSRGGGGGLKQFRKAAQISRVNAWASTATLLSLCLVAVSVYNAYVLLSSRRRYRMWMRNPDDKVSSQNARLVPIHLNDDDDKPSLQDRLIALVLNKLNEVPVLGWFLPDVPDFGRRLERDAQIHELNVWEAPEVPLRIAVVFSPLHASLWHVAGTSLLPIGGFLAWIFFFVSMAAFSLHSYGLVFSFTSLVKDRALLAAEVMREYDEKFVLPRAMPEVRDACVMTSQAEMIFPSDWMVPSSSTTDRQQAPPPSRHTNQSNAAATNTDSPARRVGKADGRKSRLRDESEQSGYF